MIVAFFVSTSGPDISYQVSSQLAFWVTEKNFKISFGDDSLGIHLRPPIGRFLPIFDLQVTLMLPTKFSVNWPFVSEKKKKNTK